MSVTRTPILDYATSHPITEFEPPTVTEAVTVLAIENGTTLIAMEDGTTILEIE